MMIVRQEMDRYSFPVGITASKFSTREPYSQGALKWIVILTNGVRQQR